jgi:hypothetical protein
MILGFFSRCERYLVWPSGTASGGGEAAELVLECAAGHIAQASNRNIDYMIDYMAG